MAQAANPPRRAPQAGATGASAGETRGTSPAGALEVPLGEALRRLRRRLRVDLLVLALSDRPSSSLRICAVEALLPSPMSSFLELPEADSPAVCAWRQQEPVILDDLTRESRWPDALEAFRQVGIRSLCAVPLGSTEERLGVVQLCSVDPGIYSRSELSFIRDCLASLLPALAGVQDLGPVATGAGRLPEAVQLELLLRVTNALVAKRDLRELVAEISSSIGRVLPTNHAILSIYDPESRQLRIEAVTSLQGTERNYEDVVFPLEGSPAGAAFRTGQPLRVSRLEATEFPSEVTRWLISEGIRSACWLPLVRGGRVLGVLDIASTREDALQPGDVGLLVRIADQVALAVENSLAFREIAELRDRLAKEKNYLEAEIRSEFNDEEIIGESPAWKRVMEEARNVADTDANVLILGETGSGKELVARAIHNLSRRRDHTFVRVCCPAVPSGLLESELFGHERGAYTGAVSQKIGRFELAHHGTMFLDEIGDMPLELQPKLLRALEEHEFERLGSNRVIRVDARIIAATNRDLREMVKRREFREDLYYRLNVFPIHVPPLRERREDISLLVRYFVQKFVGQMGKRIETIPPEIFEALVRWDWPGNVRELANLMERSVVLARGPRLEIPLAELQQRPAVAGKFGEAGRTLAEIEREEIRRVLRDCHGVISGPGGAAARLGLKRTTLNYKMKRLGITRFE
ncbi:MAG TPA: sigma 54-interacting transcriptional regulator [Thermoanaerobaculaceae bacterium]|nr:sigma 54-interacting transcriptional regulator [Thermoanaerobaculaceae bacterium]